MLHLLEMAMSNSVEKLKTMLKVPILIEGNSVMSLDRLDTILTPSESGCTGVLLGVRGDVSGSLLISLSDRAVGSLCAMAPEELRQFMPDPAELARALMEEMGNLLASTYLDVFSDVCGLRLLPTPPEFIQGPSSTIISGFLLPLEQSSSIDSARLLTSYLVLRSQETRMLVAALFSVEVTERLLEGARRTLPELF